MFKESNLGICTRWQDCELVRRVSPFITSIIHTESSQSPTPLVRWKGGEYRESGQMVGMLRHQGGRVVHPSIHGQMGPLPSKRMTGSVEHGAPPPLYGSSSMLAPDS